MSWLNWAKDSKVCFMCQEIILTYPCCYCGFKPDKPKEVKE